MVLFLSDEWIDELAEAAAADEALAGATEGIRLGVQQVVTADEVVRYWVLLDDGVVRVGRGELEGADVVFTADPPTAVGLATGSLSVQDAVASGGLQITGDVPAMIRQAANLARVGDAFAPIRARTTY